MAGIKQPIQDILTELAKIQVTDLDKNTGNLYARIWNNQLKYIRDGESYNWPRPAVFVEIIAPVQFQILGQGFRDADLGIKLHLIHEFYNQDGTFEQDLGIFDIRDQIIIAMTGYTPTACGQMVCISEEQDFDHDNLYHYILDFVCNFVDSKANPEDQGKQISEITPNLDVEVVDGGVPTPTVDPNPEFTIPNLKY